MEKKNRGKNEETEREQLDERKREYSSISLRRAARLTNRREKLRSRKKPEGKERTFSYLKRKIDRE